VRPDSVPTGDFRGIEHVEVDVDVELVADAIQPIQLREHGWSGAPQIVDADLLDA
jgi:hypothetical protein